MFRAFLKFVLFLALIGGVWWGTRYLAVRDDVVATIVFKEAEGLRKGADVRLRDEVIGSVREVHPVGSKVAVTVHVGKRHRGGFLTDSLFEITGDPAYIRVVSSIAVGAPIADGAVIIAERDRMTTFIAHGGEKLQPHIESARRKAAEWIEDFDNGAFQKKLDDWKTKAPEWKKSGKETFDENLDEMKKQVDELERSLRAASRNIEADKLRREFDDWVVRVSRD
ncbi:MAG: hypothetical protein HYU52_01555 [Acidobacteria bacterium]|nr:hypothetical protein [Acidobacteriota bacterium]